MPTFLIRDVRILNPGREVVRGDVLIRGGRIVAAGLIPHAALSDVKEAVCIDGENRLLTPGLIDLHTEGIVDRLHEAGPAGLRAAARELSRFGVTTAVPTLAPAIRPGWREQLAETVQALCSVREVHIPGLHLAGPFMSPTESAGPAQPGDLAVLEAILAACDGRLAAMSVCPERPGILPVIRRLRSACIPVFLATWQASGPELDAAIAAGATHLHRFTRPADANVLQAFPEAQPPRRGDPARGINRSTTFDPAATPAEFWRRVTLITGPGENAPADSVRPMIRGLASLLQSLQLPPQQVWAMATLNPARILGLERKGRLEPGADADLVLWEENLTPAITWVGGECTFTKTRTPRTVPLT